ncbi:MAG TPA: arginine N-succinyltransferase [Polyangiaceae bacterium]|jgi:arginine N-succinyltransferase|nr:arginine N-succinyltransferase [Polyangiaceae bacterium]
MPHRYEIRGAGPADEEQLYEVARHLNTVNLPADRSEIRGLLEHSRQSFTGAISDPRKREYVFVVSDRERDRIVGTSMIIAQLGRRDAPYIYVDVFDEERYSATLDKHFGHVVLKIGYSYSGPTELGGLIVDPEYRKKPERLGLLISYVRFLYIKMHRELFRDDLLAELLPPLEPDGTSHLWNAVGRKFTEMTYPEADRLSKKNKEFVKGLFPEGPIYATLLPEDAQAVIGKVGAQTRGVERMLRRIGFHYAFRVDPFDGGPHFTARTDDVALVARSHRAKIVSLAGPAQAEAPHARALHAEAAHAGHVEVPRTRAILAVESHEAPFFRAMLAPWRAMAGGDDGENGACVGAAAAAFLGVAPGDSVWVLPIE